MIVDYHMHLRNERGEIDHSIAAVEPFVEHALASGIEEIGFTEHVYYFRQTSSLWSVPYQVERCVYDLDDYVDSILEAKGRGLPVKLGLEVDYQPHFVEETNELLDPYPWDYLLGSVHFIDGYGIDGEPKLIDAVGIDGAWSRYFGWLNGAIALVDVLAHPDLIKFFGGLEKPENYVYDYEELCSNCEATGVALEISTAGLYKPHGELYPSAEFLEIANDLGSRITLASDAHAPQDVGRDLDKAIDHARAAGYETVTVFDQRKPRQEPLG